MDGQVVFAYLLALLALYILVQLLYLPARLMTLLALNGFLGGVMLWLINLAGQFFDFHIGLNPVTALTAGFLGFPGAAALVILRTIIP